MHLLILLGLKVNLSLYSGKKIFINDFISFIISLIIVFVSSLVIFNKIFSADTFKTSLDTLIFTVCINCSITFTTTFVLSIESVKELICAFLFNFSDLLKIEVKNNLLEVSFFKTSSKAITLKIPSSLKF